MAIAAAPGDSNCKLRGVMESVQQSSVVMVNPAANAEVAKAKQGQWIGDRHRPPSTSSNR